MRFDLISEEPAPVDSRGELVLDETLQAVADQLQADARSLHLAAGDPGEGVGGAPPKRRSYRLPTSVPFFSGMVMLAAVALGLILAVSLPQGERPRPAADTPSPTPVSSHQPPQPLDREPWTRLSEPELEGYLDLEQRPRSRISI